MSKHGVEKCESTANELFAKLVSQWEANGRPTHIGIPSEDITIISNHPQFIQKFGRVSILELRSDSSESKSRLNIKR